MQIQKRWLTPSDLQKEYGFSKSTQAKMRMASTKLRIPFSKIGGKFIRYDRLEIDKWLETHKVVGVEA
jgi:predicted DNA-binding transcriptional regulator AlpA